MSILRTFFTALVAVIFIMQFPLPAQNQVQRNSYKILGISVQGNKSADPRTIILNSGLRVGDEIQIPGEQTLLAIKHLWSLNIFSDVQIEIEKKLVDGVYLLIKVEEYSRFEQVVFRGNDEVSTTDLEKKFTLSRGQILKPQEISRLKQIFYKMYDDEGYLNAYIEEKYFSFFEYDSTEDYIEVTWRNDKNLAEEYKTKYERSDIFFNNMREKIKNRILLIFDIKENDKVVVRSITFKGNSKFTGDDLKAEFKETEESKWWKFWSSAKLDKKKYDEDKALLQSFYRKSGFRDAEIISDSLIYSNDKKDVRIQIELHEGAQYHVRNITWEGNKIYTAEVLNERLGFQKGDVFNYEKFQQNLRQNEKQNDVASLYLDNGYLTFNLKPNETKVEGDSIDINIQITERNQFKIGTVDIIGNDKTKDKVIRRELYTIPNDFFNRALMLRSLQQLANLQYFNVEKLYQEGVDYQLGNDSIVNVTFKVEEKSSDYLNASVGYSGSYGFSGAIGVTLTNFSITEPFQMGGGQVLSFNWQFGVGNYYRTFSLGFTEPWFMDTPTSLGAEVFDTRQQYIYDMQQTGLTVRVGRRLRWPDDYFSVSGFIRYQKNDVKNGGYYYVEGKTQQVTLGATIARKNIDNPIFPSTGSSNVFDAEISGGPLPGNVDFFKLNFKSEWYKRLFNISKLVLYNASEVGYIGELVTGTQIPPFEQYFMGGNGLVINTLPLRGYDDRTVGPKSISGDIYGGKAYFKYTTELRFAVSLEPIPLYLITFAEAGNVFKNLNTTKAFDLRRSVGVGARVMINPVGLIGFDLGYGFDKKVVDGSSPSWIFHFQFGKGF